MFEIEMGLSNNDKKEVETQKKCFDFFFCNIG